jgi:hypothetical protein
MITARQLETLKEALQPVLDSATSEASAARSLADYDYAARVRRSALELVKICDEGIADRKEVES